MSTSRRDLLRTGARFAIPLCLAAAAAIAAPARAHADETPTALTTPLPEPALARRWILAPEFSLGLPQPAIFGLEIHSSDRPDLRGFVEAGWFRYPLLGGPRDLHIASAQIGARWFPFSGGRGWYLAPALGYRQAAVSTTLPGFQLDNTVTISDATISASTLYFGLALGANVRLAGHLYLGLDVGLQIALMGGGNLTFHSTDPNAAASDPSLLNPESDAMDRIGRLLVPQLTVLRLSWVLD